MNVIIRKAKIDDAEKIIDINIKEWWSTYKGLIPDGVIAEIQVKDQARIERTKKQIKENNNYFVAEIENKVVGFSSFGKSKDTDYPNSAEIYTCYVLDEYHGMKLGRMLANKIMEELIDNGYKTMITKCLVGNPFNAWHKALGGELKGTVLTDIRGYELEENVYYHNDLKRSYIINKNKLVEK